MDPLPHPSCAIHSERLLSVEEKVNKIQHVVMGNGDIGLSENVRKLTAQARDTEKDVQDLKKVAGQIKRILWIGQTILTAAVLVGPDKAAEMLKGFIDGL